MPAKFGDVSWTSKAQKASLCLTIICSLGLYDDYISLEVTSTASPGNKIECSSPAEVQEIAKGLAMRTPFVKSCDGLVYHGALACQNQECSTSGKRHDFEFWGGDNGACSCTEAGPGEFVLRPGAPSSRFYELTISSYSK